MKFLNHTERLADDVYDVSQIAYDNDREEMGKQLTDLLSTLDRDQDQIEAYAVSFLAFSTASSTAPTYMNACSGS